MDRLNKLDMIKINDVGKKVLNNLIIYILKLN